MNPIFMVQWMKERRSPYLVLIFCGASIIAALVLGLGMDTKPVIGVFPAPGTDAAIADEWTAKLGESAGIDFVRKDEQEARSEVREGRADAAVQVMAGDYRIIASIESPNVQMVERHVQAVFARELQLLAVAEQAKDPAVARESIERYLEEPPLAVHMRTPDGGGLAEHDMSRQLLFTFTLFLVMFTIGFKVNAITAEKVSGIWNRIILSPVSKTAMYSGHLLYSSIIGFVQIAAIFVLFKVVFGYDLGERFGLLLMIAALYTLSVVALSMLFTGVLRTPEQFNMLFPSVVPVMPLISGAYMPPGTITNEWLLALAQLFPITHALEAMMEVSVYGGGWQDVFVPIAKLCLIGVVCMGVGINWTERRGK